MRYTLFMGENIWIYNNYCMIYITLKIPKVSINVIEKYCLNNPENWRPYGGNQNNAGIFENQQSSPENALVEKITNSIDAILMKQCLIRGISPREKEMSDVPKDMFQAVENFWGVKDGRWENVTASERNEVAQNLQIILSSDKKTPNV